MRVRPILGNEDIRRRVADHYRRAGTNESACCEPGSQDPRTMNQLGYSTAEMSGLPPAAAVNSYGCGSPVSFSEIQPDDTVLDLGCGGGLDLLLAAKKVGPGGRVIGIDMTDKMLETARANVAAAGMDNVDIREGYMEDIPVTDESVEWVISNFVINLSPDKRRVFREIARVLKPGGHLRIADIVAEDLPEWIRESADLYDACVAGAISETEYVTGLASAGLTNVSVGGRYVYDRQQLGDVAAGPLASCADAKGVAESLVGRVWSVYISARKPAPEERREQQ